MLFTSPVNGFSAVQNNFHHEITMMFYMKDYLLKYLNCVSEFTRDKWIISSRSVTISHLQCDSGLHIILISFSLTGKG